jgi:copper(I)-binding protein
MFKVDRIKVPGREVLLLQPGARHIMVFNLPKHVREGSEVRLRLMFERSGERKVTVRFEKPAGMPGGH